MQSTAQSSSNQPNEKEDTWLPEGYVVVIGPDNKKYIMPDFMVPGLDQDYQSKEKKEELRVLTAKGTVCDFFVEHITPLRGIGHTFPDQDRAGF